MRTLEVVLALVSLAVLVAILARRVNVPAPSLLVMAGLVIGVLPGVPAVDVPPDVVAVVVLPPLIYAAAVDVSVGELRRVLRPLLTLAIGLVAVTAVAVAVTVHLLEPKVPIEVALVLGAVLASTDPVAVSALARRLHLPPRLLALVQGESLLNDATSLVLYKVAVGVVVVGTAVGASPPSAPSVVGQFLLLGGGGALIGAAGGYAIRGLRRIARDPVIATVLALLTPYAVYTVAEVAHTSGVTAVVLCGLMLSASRDTVTRGPVRVAVDGVYAVVVFLLESVIFVVIGLQLPALVQRLRDGEGGVVPLALAVTAVVVLTRVVWIYPTGYLQRRRTATRTDEDQVPWNSLAVLSWAGTRGVVPLAAALAIPLTVDGGGPFPYRDLVLVLATSCIILTLIVQGLTLEPLVRRLRIGEDPEALERERRVGRHETALAALHRLDEIEHGGPPSGIPRSVLTRVRRDVETRVAATRSALARTSQADAARGSAGRTTDPAFRRLRLELLATENDRLVELRDRGDIGEPTRRALARSLDLEETRLVDESRGALD